MEENLLETTERLIAVGDIENDGRIVKTDNDDKKNIFAKDDSETKESETKHFKTQQGIQSWPKN